MWGHNAIILRMWLLLKMRMRMRMARARARMRMVRAVGWGVEAQHVQQVKSLYLTKYLAIFV